MRRPCVIRPFVLLWKDPLIFLEETAWFSSKRLSGLLWSSIKITSALLYQQLLVLFGKIPGLLGEGRHVFLKKNLRPSRRRPFWSFRRGPSGFIWYYPLYFHFKEESSLDCLSSSLRWEEDSLVFFEETLCSSMIISFLFSTYEDFELS